MFNPKVIKKNFPILNRQINGKDHIYLDNAATSQKPQVVIDAISNYYQSSNANVHRGVHILSDISTTLLEESRQTIAEFFGAENEEVIITRNATEAINGVAYGWVDHNLQEGDVILTTMMEHHANIVPWQEACKRTGATLQYIKVDEYGLLDLDDLNDKCQMVNVKLITLTHVSNVLGTVNPIEEIVKLVKKNQPLILVDGAQSASHMKIDFDKLGADFYVFSGHKMLGPMGVGGLLVRKELLESNEFRPWLFGGGMIGEVRTSGTEFNDDLAERFTAGTPDVASVVGLAEACKYLEALGMDNVEKHDRELVEYALGELNKIEKIQIVGPHFVESDSTSRGEELQRLGSVAFIYKGVHAHDVAQILDSEGVAVRSGHHCCMPLHEEFGWASTVRVSFQIYNDFSDIDRLISALTKVRKVFGD